MKKFAGILFAVLLCILSTAAISRADDVGDDVQRIRSSHDIFNELMQTPDNSIPSSLLDSAQCIAIIPGVKKAAFLFGGQYGKGVAMCDTAHGWSAPVFVMLAGGSFGFQIGGASTDLVLIFRNRNGLDRLLSDKFKIGADVTAAAGPLGRHASASTDLEMHAEILTYSRSHGVFAGVSLNGAVVKPDESGDQALYGNHVNRLAVLDGKVAVPQAAKNLVAEVNEYTGETTAAAIVHR